MEATKMGVHMGYRGIMEKQMETAMGKKLKSTFPGSGIVQGSWSSIVHKLQLHVQPSVCQNTRLLLSC